MVESVGVESTTQLQLERILMATNRCQFVSLTAVTDPDMNKRNNPFAGFARKVSFATGVICWQYSSAVNRQRARESTGNQPVAKFVSMPRTWGSRIKGTPLVSYQTENEVRLYLELKRQAVQFHYFDRHTHHRIDLAELTPFLTKRETESNRQEVDQQVVLRDYRLINIAELTLAGIRYTIAPAAAELQAYFPKAKAARPQTSRRARPRTSTNGRHSKPAKGAS
jgi:hypothetical protein